MLIKYICVFILYFTVQQQLPKYIKISHHYSMLSNSIELGSMPYVKNIQNYKQISQQFPEFNLKKIPHMKSKTSQNQQYYSNMKFGTNQDKLQINDNQEQINKCIKNGLDADAIINSPKNYKKQKLGDSNIDTTQQRTKPTIFINRNMETQKNTINFKRQTLINPVNAQKCADKLKDNRDIKYRPFFSPNSKKTNIGDLYTEKKDHLYGSPKIYKVQDNNIHTEIEDTQLSTLRSQNHILKKTVEIKNSEILNLKQQLTKIKEQKNIIQKENEITQEQITIVRRLNEELLGKYNILKTQIEKDKIISEQNSKNLHISHHQTLSIQNCTGIKAQIQDLKNQHENLVNALKAQNLKLQVQLKQLRLTYKKKQEQLNKLFREISFMRQDIHFLHDTRDKYQLMIESNNQLNQQLIQTRVKILNMKYQHIQDEETNT